MSYTRIIDLFPYVDANGDPASGYVVQAYGEGDTPGAGTVISLATDSAGTNPQTSVTLNSKGVPEVSGSEVNLYINQNYKLAIYPTAAAAAAYSGASWGPVDNIKRKSTDTARTVATKADLVALTGVVVGDRVETLGYTSAGDYGANLYEAVAAATGTDDGGSFIDSTGSTSIQWKGLFPGSFRIQQWGVKNDGSTDNATTGQAVIDYINSITGGIVLLSEGSFNFGSGLTWKPGVVFEGEGPDTTELVYTAASGDFITGGADLNRIAFKNLRIRSSNTSTGWAILFDTATVRQPRVENVVIEGFLKGAKVSDGLDGVIDQLYIVGQSKTAAGGIGLQLGNAPGDAGTTWKAESVYVTVVRNGVICYASTSSFNRITVENSTEAITTYASGDWENIYSEANTDFWFINTTGINIKAFREGASSGSDFTFEDGEVERRTTITPAAADTNVATIGKNFTYKTGTFYQYFNGQNLFTSDGCSSTNANMPTIAGMIGAINLWTDGTTEAELKIAVPDKIDAGIGKNLYLQAGGAKAGETNTDGGDLMLQGGRVTGNGRSGVRVLVAGGNASGTTTYAPTEVWIFDTSKHLRPLNTGVSDIGSGSTEVRYIYLVNAPVVSSDRSLKEQETDLDEVEKATALQIKRGLKKYKLKSEVEIDADGAKWHFGAIAQEVEKAFIDNNLNPLDYNLLSVSEYEEDGKTKTKLGLLYEELLCFIIASI